MRLSEAIRLGSLAIQNSKRGDSRYCAIGMGLEAIGKRNMVSESANYRVLNLHWPWTAEARFKEYSKVYPVDFIWQTFDGRVCEGAMTLDAMCDEVKKWEDELAAKGINVEQMTMAAELSQPTSPTQSIQESVAVLKLEEKSNGGISRFNLRQS